MHADDAGRGRVLAFRRPRRAPRIGAIGGSVDVTGAAGDAGLDPRFAAELQGYADRGAGLPADVIEKAKAAYNEAKDYAAKAAAVGEDTSMGAAIGAMVPILGELGIGEAVGAIIGAIYGVFDNFGGEIHDLFNPPDFEEDDYQRMQRTQLASGAIPVYGVPPDQYGACIYPDGALSGGDFPYPGTWNGEVRDQAAYDRAKKRDAVAQYGVTIGPDGMPAKPLIPIAVRNRGPVREILTKREQLSKSLSATVTNKHVRDLLEAELARRKQLSKSLTSIFDNKAARASLKRFLANPAATPAPVAVKATAPAAPSSPATTAVIIGTGAGVSGLVAAALWWLTRGRG